MINVRLAVYSDSKDIFEWRNADDEQWDRAYESRLMSVAASRKKRVAMDAIENAKSGKFP